MRQPPFAELSYAPEAVLPTAIHAGHHVPEDIRPRIALTAAERLREEDPFTDRIAGFGPAGIVCRYSRFVVDVNRPRDQAVYRTPDQAWGLRVWTDPSGPPASLVRRSLQLYDRFYRQVETLFRRILHARGPFVVFDVHSYNHRRDGPDGSAADPEANPEVNVGTGSLDRERWAPVVEAFVSEMASPSGEGAHDVRENVRFRGGHFSRWIHETFPDSVCCLAIELKKTFMDEWTGEPDPKRIDGLRGSLRAAAARVEQALEESAVRA